MRRCSLRLQESTDGLQNCASSFSLSLPLRLQVMRLNKVGSFTMANLGQSKSIVADFMKSKKKQDGSSFEEGMLKLLRTL
jgi:magnesium chelatase subunit H